MKELSIEEKAKAYDEALEKARDNYKAALEYCDGAKIGIECFKNTLTNIFPMLKEPKTEDEKIKKALIDYFYHHKVGINIFYGIKGDDIIAWLEKQGKYQIHYWTEEEIEPIISDYLRGAEHYGGMIARLRCLKPKSLEKQGESYTKRDVDNAYLEGMAFAKNELEKQAEVVSDKDDIEAEEKGIRKAFNKIWEEKQDKQKSQRMISAEAKEAMYDKPADTVEQKCEESKTKVFDAPTPFEDKLYVFVAACEFLAIPSKIEFILEHSQEILDAAREQIGKEQKPAWSEEDENILDAITYIVKNSGYKHCIGVSNEMMIAFIKSLKDRVLPKQEWSEKDEEELEIAIDTLKESGRYDSAKWVQSLKQRIGG